MIILGILVVLAGAGIMWLWQYAYSPQGRARIIIAQLKNDTTSLRGWMLQHHLVRPGYPIPSTNDEENALTDIDAVIHPALDYAYVKVVVQTAVGEMVKLGREALPVDIEALRDDNRDVQMMAVLACGEFHDPRAIQPLAQCACDANGGPSNTASRPAGLQGDSQLQAFCLDSLVKIGPEASGPLLVAARECDEMVQRNIPEMVARMWGAAAVPHLIKLIDESDGIVRDNAAVELGKSKDKRATDVLIRHLTLRDEYAAVSAARALGEIGDPKAIPALLRTLQDEQTGDYIRVPAAGALARMGRDDGLQFVMSMFNSSDGNDRALAATELGIIRIKGTLELLLPLLHDSEADIRWTAMEALGELNDPRAIPAIRKLLNDPVDYAREVAAKVLRKLGDKPPPATQPGKP